MTTRFGFLDRHEAAAIATALRKNSRVTNAFTQESTADRGGYSVIVRLQDGTIRQADTPNGAKALQEEVQE